MATWHTDVLGTGLAHVAPTDAERTLARRIARCWKAWHPILLHELRSRPPGPPGTVAREIHRLERAHAKAVKSLLASGVSFARIWRTELDDPRLSDEERAARVANRRNHRTRKPKPTREEREAVNAERKRKREAAYVKVGRRMVRRELLKEASDASSQP